MPEARLDPASGPLDLKKVKTITEGDEVEPPFLQVVDLDISRVSITAMDLAFFKFQKATV
jgi:hypothetical protein